MPRNDPFRTKIRRNLELDKVPAILGDASGTIYEPGKVGYVRVRYISASGQGWPQTVGKPRRETAMLPNAAVWVYYDPDEGELAVWGPRIGGQLAQGLNPYANDGGQADASGAFVDLSKALTLMSHPTAEPSLSVAVKAWIYVRDGTVHQYTGGIIDLTSDVPASTGEHGLAGLFLKTDDTIEVVDSTPKSALDPLTLADVQECVTGMTAGSLPVWFWKLENGQTTITAEHSFLDGRQWVNVSTTTEASSITSGITAPATTPAHIGFVYIDTAAGDIYMAKGTSSSADWIKVN